MSVSGDSEMMKQTESILCSAGFLSGVPQANWLLICGEFDQTAFRDVIEADTKAIYMAQEMRQRAL